MDHLEDTVGGMIMKKRLLCCAMALILLFFLCSCRVSKPNTPEVPADLRIDGQSYILSKILMTKIAHDYEMDCATLVFEEGDKVLYKDVFRYFNYSGCYSFDYKTLSPLVYSYYDQQTGKFSIPHDVVDDFMTERFNTVPDPESIDCYDKATGCYEMYQHFGGLYCNIVPGAKEEIRENVYRFVVEILPGESYDIGLDTNYRTYVVELTATGYKILSHQHGNPYNMDI